VIYGLAVRPGVDADLIEAEAWYEQQQTGLGREFLLAARETIESLSANPLTRFVPVASRCVGLTRSAFLTGSSFA
jgi:hypothetical protein